MEESFGLDFNCEKCGMVSVVQVKAVVLPDSPELTALQNGEFNKVSCEHCGNSRVINAPFIMYQPEAGRLVTFIVGFPEMPPEVQQEIIEQLVNMLETTGGLNFQDSEEEVQIAVVGNYEMMVGLANGEEPDEPQGLTQEEIQNRLNMLNQLLQSDPLQRAVFYSQNRALVPELAMVAEVILPQLPPQMQPEMQKLAQALRQKAEEFANTQN